MMSKQQLLLLKLMEECNEVSKVCSKAIQFGLGDIAPDKIYTNAEKLNQELNDIQASIDMLNIVGFSFKEDKESQQSKKLKVIRYSKYSQSLGLVE